MRHHFRLQLSRYRQIGLRVEVGLQIRLASLVDCHAIRETRLTPLREHVSRSLAIVRCDDGRHDLNETIFLEGTVNALHDRVAYAIDDSLHVRPRAKMGNSAKELWRVKLRVIREKHAHLFLQWISSEITVTKNMIGRDLQLQSVLHVTVLENGHHVLFRLGTS